MFLIENGAYRAVRGDDSRPRRRGGRSRTFIRVFHIFCVPISHRMDYNDMERQDSILPDTRYINDGNDPNKRQKAQDHAMPERSLAVRSVRADRYHVERRQNAAPPSAPRRLRRRLPSRRRRASRPDIRICRRLRAVCHTVRAVMRRCGNDESIKTGGAEIEALPVRI